MYFDEVGIQDSSDYYCADCDDFDYYNGVRLEGQPAGHNRLGNHSHGGHGNQTHHKKKHHHGGVKVNTRISTEGYQDTPGNSDNHHSVKSVSHSFKSDFDLAAVKAKYGISDDNGGGRALSRGKRQVRRGYRGPALPRFAGIEHRFLREKIVGELGYPEGRLDRRAPVGFRAAGFTPVSLTDFSIASTGTAGRVNP